MSTQFKKQGSILILFTIFALSINLRPAITSIGPMLETIREQLSLTNVHVSLLTAIPVFCMGVFASLAPIFNRQLGLKRTMYIMLILIGVMTALRGVVSGFPILIGTAFIIGISIAVIGPLLSAMIKQHFPDRAASVIGVYSFGMGVGSAASAGLTGLFYETTGSYFFALSIWSVLVIIGLVSWFFMMRDNIEVRQTAPKVVQAKARGKSPWKTRKAWLFLLFFGLQSSLFFSIITWLAPIASSAGMTLLQAGTLLSVMTTVQIFLNILLPLMMEKYPARKFWINLMLASGLLATILFWTGFHPLMWVGAVIMGIPLGGLFPVALLLPLDETDNADETNSWTAMMQTGGFIMAGILPLLIAFIFDRTSNHTYTFIILITMYLVMFALTVKISDKKGSF
ncbi:CynX/NimT family MFS transporter [Sporosarcina sp. 6E9]|uniref:MFS transporter n=1 Tax=Sporosarcina sp. 6E9 TaxID=2819235 RepID=UPI001B307870|nr:MFS transporter [Sporosarcina sp. 6E9]